MYDVRIADYGFATTINEKSDVKDPLLTITCGTPGYIAPEAIDGKGFTTKSDLFSIGAVLYNMLSLKNLFKGKGLSELIYQN